MLKQYGQAIRALQNIKEPNDLPLSLKLEQSGDLSIYYAPFDYINNNAKLVICGITPGFSQAKTALMKAQQSLANEATFAEASKLAKNTASFSGKMRSNLVNILDDIGIADKLGVFSTASLFAENSELVHYTSALRYPVFKGEKNYSGIPHPVKNPLLCSQIDSYLAEEAEALGNSALWLALGEKVGDALGHLVSKDKLSEEQYLGWIPHPSGANAERIAYFIGRKKKADLSNKVDSDKLDRAKSAITTKLKKASIAL